MRLITAVFAQIIASKLHGRQQQKLLNDSVKVEAADRLKEWLTLCNTL